MNFFHQVRRNPSIFYTETLSKPKWTQSSIKLQIASHIPSCKHQHEFTHIYLLSIEIFANHAAAARFWPRHYIHYIQYYTIFMALFDSFLWNCIKLAPLRAAWNVSPDAIISERMILFAHSSAKPPNQCDYSFWYFAWAHRSFLCSVHVHIHKDLLDSFLVSSSREVWVHCFFAIER